MGRGRPPLSAEERARIPLTIKLSPERMRAVMHAAADDPDGPMTARDWVERLVALNATLPKGVEP